MVWKVAESKQDQEVNTRAIKICVLVHMQTLKYHQENLSQSWERGSPGRGGSVAARRRRASRPPLFSLGTGESQAMKLAEL